MDEATRNVDLPLGATVYCVDGECGHCVAVIYNPLTRALTHFVLESLRPHRRQYLVPVKDVVSSDHHQLALACRRDDLSQYRLFKHVEFLPVEKAEMPFIPDLIEDSTFIWPYLQVAGSTVVQVDVEEVPAHELAVHRGARVRASDGDIGRVDEFVVNPATGGLSYLVMHEGHLWGQKEVAIPLSAVDHVDDDVVYLGLDKEGVGKLPAIATRRW